MFCGLLLTYTENRQDGVSRSRFQKGGVPQIPGEGWSPRRHDQSSGRTLRGTGKGEEELMNE